MKIIRRLLANVIDIFVFGGLLITSYLFVLPFFMSILRMEEANTILAGVIILLVILGTFVVQYPFMTLNQTIGKTFFGLRIISTNPERPLTVSIIVQREVFAKVMPVYLLCLPVLFGKEGKHEEATETAVE